MIPGGRKIIKTGTIDHANNLIPFSKFGPYVGISFSPSRTVGLFKLLFISPIKRENIASSPQHSILCITIGDRTSKKIPKQTKNNAKSLRFFLKRRKYITENAKNTNCPSGRIIVAHAKNPNDEYIIFLLEFKKSKIPIVIAKI